MFRDSMNDLYEKLNAIRLGWREYTWEFGGDDKYGWLWAKKVYNKESAKEFLKRMERKP